MTISEKITEILRQNIQLEINYENACVDVINFEETAGKVMDFLFEITGIEDVELGNEEFNEGEN